MSKNEKKYIKEYVERKCDYDLSLIISYLEMIKSYFVLSNLGEEIEKKFNDLYKQVSYEYEKDMPDELEGEFVVQYGYNRVNIQDN